jgi:hypothetical protein
MRRLDEEMSHAGRSTLELVKSVATDTEELIRKEIELAKHEVTEAIAARISNFAAIAASGVFALFALGFAGLAGAHALERWFAPWSARLLIAGAYLVLAGCALAIAAARRRGAPASIAPAQAAEQVKQTLKEEVEWARAQLKR